MKLKYPIIYKVIPTQYAFYVHDDGTVNTHQVNVPPSTKKFKDIKKAQDYINNLKEII